MKEFADATWLTCKPGQSHPQVTKDWLTWIEQDWLLLTHSWLTHCIQFHSNCSKWTKQFIGMNSPWTWPGDKWLFFLAFIASTSSPNCSVNKCPAAVSALAGHLPRFLCLFLHMSSSSLSSEPEDFCRAPRCLRLFDALPPRASLTFNKPDAAPCWYP